jgi:hypothetical protein
LTRIPVAGRLGIVGGALSNDANTGAGTASLAERLTVAACIGCGARSRAGACAEGCADVPLDLVDAGDVDALATHVRGLERRVRALRALGDAANAPPHELRERARAALRLPVPPRDAATPIVEAWGCPDCGRIDAPRPCLGVCERRPLLMADASEYRCLAVVADELADEERRRLRGARLIASVRARPGYEHTTDAALRALLTSNP